MGNRRLHKIERFHMLGPPESERLKVTALNLFHPTASPLLQRIGFFILRHSLVGERGRGEGALVPNSTKGGPTMATPIHWETSLTTAKARAKKEKKLILMDFYNNL